MERDEGKSILGPFPAQLRGCLEMSPTEIRARILALQLRIEAMSYRAARLKLEGKGQEADGVWDQVETLRAQIVDLQMEARDQGERN